MTWLPIESALKDGETRVLLWVADAHPPRAIFGKVGEYDDGEVFFIIEGHNGDWKVTHWQPDPSPPPVSRD